MTRILTLALLTGSLLLAPAAHAADGDDWSPKKLYMLKGCQPCHGKEGRKPIQDYPLLAGQNRDYMLAQINEIDSGKRSASPDATGHPRTEGMKGVLVNLNADQRAKVAQWLSEQNPQPLAPLQEPAPADAVERGKKAYTKFQCHTCHGEAGLKPKPGYPILGGQKKAYLVNQMKDIKAGVRSNPKVKIMTGFIKRVADGDMTDIADYLASVPR
ncbi:MAG: c-type cytochrome [Magnetococcus sp. WYHC-3]